jgi:NTE family protein
MAKKKSCPTRGLVLSGGGARAAYQAGVIKAIADIQLEEGITEPPFQVYTGESAGAINVSLLASHADNFQTGARELWDCWASLQMDDIIATNPVSLLSNAGRWMADLGMGGLLPQRGPSFLLDNTPLKNYLAPRIQFGRIRELLHENQLLGLGISVTNYATGSAVTFYDSARGIKPWARSHRLGMEAELKLDHVLASTAIPILFPAVQIGQSYFGDGSVRMKAPLSPCIHLGANSILAIGLRYYRTPQQTVEINENWKMDSISLADVAGVLLNAGFLDNLDSDLERLERINHTLGLIPPEKHKELSNELHRIHAVALRPSEDLGSLASGSIDSFGKVLKFLLKGLGIARNSSWDLVSYLAFDKAYTSKLLTLGYADGIKQRRAILEFLNG